MDGGEIQRYVNSCATQFLEVLPSSDCTFSEYINNRLKSISKSSSITAPASAMASNIQQPQPHQATVNYNIGPPPSSHPQGEEMNFAPRGRWLPPRVPHVGLIGCPPIPPPLLNRPMSIPHNPAMDNRARGPPPGIMGGRGGPFPPHLVPTTDFHHFANGGSGGTPNQVMYLSQPGPVYSNGRTVLIPRMPIGPMMGHHPGMSQQAMHQFHGPHQPPPLQVLNMNPQGMCNPYLTVNPNFNVPVYPPKTAHPGARDEKPEAAASDSFVPPAMGNRNRNSGGDKPMDPSSRVGTVSTTFPMEMSSNSKVVGSVAAGIASMSVSASLDKSPSRVTAGRKNYKVAQSPSKGGEGGGGAGGVSSTSGSPSVEVKAVSGVPIPSTKVEEVSPVGEFICHTFWCELACTISPIGV